MTRRAFDTSANVADRLCRCRETPYSDVLEHHTVSPTQVKGGFRQHGGRLSCSYPNPVPKPVIRFAENLFAGLGSGGEIGVAAKKKKSSVLKMCPFCFNLQPVDGHGGFKQHRAKGNYERGEGSDD